MQGLISSYSTGPVAPSDMIGRSNVSLIMMACAADGRLLQVRERARACARCWYPPLVSLLFTVLRRVSLFRQIAASTDYVCSLYSSTVYPNLNYKHSF